METINIQKTDTNGLLEHMLKLEQLFKVLGVAPHRMFKEWLEIKSELKRRFDVQPATPQRGL